MCIDLGCIVCVKLVALPMDVAVVVVVVDVAMVVDVVAGRGIGCGVI